MALPARGCALRAVLVLLAAAPPARAIDNGLGYTPPQAWRSWNAYDCTSPDRIITQAHVEAQFAAAVDASRLVGGVNTSLAQLGFDYISIDDGESAARRGAGSLRSPAGLPRSVKLPSS